MKKIALVVGHREKSQGAYGSHGYRVLVAAYTRAINKIVESEI